MVPPYYVGDFILVSKRGGPPLIVPNNPAPNLIGDKNGWVQQQIISNISCDDLICVQLEVVIYEMISNLSCGCPEISHRGLEINKCTLHHVSALDKSLMIHILSNHWRLIDIKIFSPIEFAQYIICHIKHNYTLHWRSTSPQCRLIHSMLEINKSPLPSYTFIVGDQQVPTTQTFLQFTCDSMCLVVSIVTKLPVPKLFISLIVVKSTHWTSLVWWTLAVKRHNTNSSLECNKTSVMRSTTTPRFEDRGPSLDSEDIGAMDSV